VIAATVFITDMQMHCQNRFAGQHSENSKLFLLIGNTQHLKTFPVFII